MKKSQKKINRVVRRGRKLYLEDRPEKTVKRSSNMWTVIDSIQNGLSRLPTGYVKLSQSPEVITAVDRIADLISNMTIYLMRNTEVGDVREINELSKKIDINPCEGMTKKAWMHFIVRTLLLEGDGNAVILPRYSSNNGTSYIENLLPVPSKDFDIVPGATFEDSYKIQIGNREYTPSEVIHFRINPDPNNLWQGRSYRIPLSQIISTLSAAESVKQEFMNGRYMPSLIVKVDTDAEELNEMEGKEKLLARYTSSEKAGAPWIIPAELVDVEKIAPLSLKDIGVTESVSQDKETIAALLGVPKFILGVGEFNADEYNNFVKDKVLSVAKEIEQTLTSKLLISPDLYFKFNVRSLYSYDLETLANVGGAQFDRGIMTGNEVRDWLGLSPLDDLDELKILENYIPAKDSGNQKKLDNGSEEENQDQTEDDSNNQDEENE